MACTVLPERIPSGLIQRPSLQSSFSHNPICSNVLEFQKPTSFQTPHSIVVPANTTSSQSTSNDNHPEPRTTSRVEPKEDDKKILVNRSTLNQMRQQLSRFQKAKSKWPNAETCVGLFCGMKGKYRCWEAEGTAQDVFRKISAEVSELLERTCGPVPASSQLIFDVFMIGETPATSVPQIMFSCWKAGPRKAAMETLRKSGLLSKYPGFETGHWQFPPHILDPRLLASLKEPGLGAMTGSDILLVPRFIKPASSLVSSRDLVAIQLYTSAFSGQTHTSSKATAGSRICLDGRTYYMTVAHAFAPDPANAPGSPMDEHDGVDSDEDSEFEFGGLGDGNEDAGFDDQEITSSGSMTSDSTLSEDGFGDRIAVEEDSQSSSCAGSNILPDKPFDAPGFKSRVSHGHNPQEQNEALGMDISAQQLFDAATGTVVLQSADLDYALIEANEEHDLKRLLVEDLMLSMENISTIPSEDVRISTVTGSSGYLSGTISCRPSYVRLLSSMTFQEAYKVTLDGPLNPGDSGSAIFDPKTRNLYGHIVVGSTVSKVAYVIPAVNVLKDLDIRCRATMNVEPTSLQAQAPQSIEVVPSNMIEERATIQPKHPGPATTFSSADAAASNHLDPPTVIDISKQSASPIIESLDENRRSSIQTSVSFPPVKSDLEECTNSLSTVHLRCRATVELAAAEGSTRVIRRVDDTISEFANDTVTSTYAYSDFDGIFSRKDSIASSSASSSGFHFSALSEFIDLLLHSELRPLYPLTILKFGPEKFQTNFSRLLLCYGRELQKDASNNLERQAARLVRISARQIAGEIINSVSGVMDQTSLSPEAKQSNVATLNNWLDSVKDPQEGEEEDEFSDSSISDEWELQTLEDVRSFMLSGKPYNNMGELFKQWLKLNGDKSQVDLKTEPLSADENSLGGTDSLSKERASNLSSASEIKDDTVSLQDKTPPGSPVDQPADDKYLAPNGRQTQNISGLAELKTAIEAIEQQRKASAHHEASTGKSTEEDQVQLIDSGSSMKAGRARRASRPKVKTGCNNCKNRRVKCDEIRPQCNKCMQSGRTCDGYPAYKRTEEVTVPIAPLPQPLATPSQSKSLASSATTSSPPTIRAAMVSRAPASPIVQPNEAEIVNPISPRYPPPSSYTAPSLRRPSSDPKVWRGASSKVPMIDPSEDTDTEDEMRREPPMLRKKSGELVRPALRPSLARRRPSSMPGTPSFSKAVHFDAHLEHVRHFLGVDRPLAVSTPIEEETEADFPFDIVRHARDLPFKWEFIQSNLPVRDSLQLSLPVRLERVNIELETQTFVGDVIVANLAYQKFVTVRFTLDYWKTASEVDAEYNHNLSAKQSEEYDTFTFTIRLADQANLENKTLFFAVKYLVNDQEYWDNNNSANFQVDFQKKAKTPSKKTASLSSLPRSRPVVTSRRPRSMPVNFDDFGNKFESKDMPEKASDNNTALSLKQSNLPAPLGKDNLNRRSPLPSESQGQAFANRYYFGASLSAAINAANEVLGDEEIPELKPIQDRPISVSPVKASVAFGDNPVSSNPSTEKSVVTSQSYNELLDKYCFFGSSKTTLSYADELELNQDKIPDAGQEKKSDAEGSDDNELGGSESSRHSELGNSESQMTVSASISLGP